MLNYEFIQISGCFHCFASFQVLRLNEVSVGILPFFYEVHFFFFSPSSISSVVTIADRGHVTDGGNMAACLPTADTRHRRWGQERKAKAVRVGQILLIMIQKSLTHPLFFQFYYYYFFYSCNLYISFLLIKSNHITTTNTLALRCLRGKRQTDFQCGS